MKTQRTETRRLRAPSGRRSLEQRPSPGQRLSGWRPPRERPSLRMDSDPLEGEPPVNRQTHVKILPSLAVGKIHREYTKYNSFLMSVKEPPKMNVAYLHVKIRNLFRHLNEMKWIIINAIPLISSPTLIHIKVINKEDVDRSRF